jgi:hypothetical protein
LIIVVIGWGLYALEQQGISTASIRNAISIGWSKFWAFVGMGGGEIPAT